MLALLPSLFTVLALVSSVHARTYVLFPVDHVSMQWSDNANGAFSRSSEGSEALCQEKADRIATAVGYLNQTDASASQTDCYIFTS